MLDKDKLLFDSLVAIEERDKDKLYSLERKFNKVITDLAKHPTMLDNDPKDINAKLVKIALSFSKNDDTIEKVFELLRKVPEERANSLLFDTLQNRTFTITKVHNGTTVQRIGLSNAMHEENEREHLQELWKKGSDECNKQLLPKLTDFLNRLADENSATAIKFFHSSTQSYFNTGSFDTTGKNITNFLNETKGLVKEAVTNTAELPVTTVEYLQHIAIPTMQRSIGFSLN